MTMNGMPAGETRFDGQSAAISQMGQEVPVDEDMIDGLRQQAVLFPQLDYSGKELVLAGTEKVEGKSAYVLEVTNEAGETTTEYYDIESGLLLRNVATAQGNTMTTDFVAYKTFDGIQFPVTLKMTGMAPFPIEFKVETVEVNSGIPDSEFTVE
jgi:hypothetical protein